MPTLPLKNCDGDIVGAGVVVGGMGLVAGVLGVKRDEVAHVV